MGQDPADGGSPDNAPPSWQSPSGAAPGDVPSPSQDPHSPPAPPAQQPPYGQPQYGAPQYSPPPAYGAPPQYAPPQYPPSQYGPPQYGRPQYGPPQYGPPQYGPPPGYPAAPQYAMPAYTGYGPPLAAKPGVIPLRPLAAGELLDGAFSTIRLNPKAMLGLGFVIVLIGQLIVLALNLAANGSSTGTRLAVTLATVAVTQLVASITTGAAIIVMGEAVLGARIGPTEVLERLHGRIWRLIGLGLLVALLWLLATVLLVIPGIYVFVLLSLATPVFILEKTTVGEALRRSAELVRGSWWRTFGILILATLVAGVIAGIVEIPFTLFAANSSGFLGTQSTDVSTNGQILLAIGRVIGGTLTTPIIAGTVALMYVDRRMRREGLDIVLAQAARERQGRS